MPLRSGAFLLFIAVLVPTCSKPSPDVAGGDSKPASSGRVAETANAKGRGQCKNYKACQLLTVAEVNAALGTGYTDADDDDTNLAKQAGPVVSCAYGAKKVPSDARLQVGCLYGGYDVPGIFKESEDAIKTVTPNVQKITGLGSYALLSTISVAPTHPELTAYLLQVFFGTGGNFTIDFRPGANAKAFDAVAAAKQMGSAVLARL